MLELIAQGTQPAFRWRRLIPEDRATELGRATPSFAVPWDSLISRRHVRLRFLDGRLGVQRLEFAANPVFFNGSQEEHFWLKPGEHFVIGETTFTLANDRAEVTLDVPNPISQRTFSPEYLRQVSYRDANRRIEVLNALPDLISSAANLSDLLTHIVNTLFEGIRSASTVGVVRQLEASQGQLEVIHWDRRGNWKGNFQPSESLIRQSLESGESVLHIWKSSAPSSQQSSTDSATEQYFTFDYDNDWAFCCPLDGPGTKGWAIYVAGINRPIAVQSNTATGSRKTDSGTPDLQGDVKFSELVASTLKNLMRMQQLERRQSALRNFFSPVVIQAVAIQDAEKALAPRQCRVSVLFCDLRGFSRTSERMADKLLELLDRVSESLGVTTRNILEQGGVVGDFHGDAVMGFWGWPLDEPQSALRAVSTALRIEKDFTCRTSESDLVAADFRVGLGIATGEAVAGKIGTTDQVKVTAFGPVVNLAARLESLTRMIDCSILTDLTTATEAQAKAPELQVRKIARVQPYGLSNPVDVCQVLPEHKQLSPDQFDAYTTAVSRFAAGDWGSTMEHLANLPEDDAGRMFLQTQIQSRDSKPPADWDGTVRMSSK